MEIMRRAIYPGTFDPLSNGHLDIIERSAKLFDEIVVAIGDNPDKNPLFSVKERATMIKKATAHLSNITLVKFNSLLIELSDELNSNIIIRGIRSSSDFEYESQMTYANNSLKKGFRNRISHALFRAFICIVFFSPYPFKI